MAKYQFFQCKQKQGITTTYLAMQSDRFLIEKEQLLANHYEVVGDVIDADDSEHAVEKFRAGFITPAGDDTNATAAGGLATFVIETYQSIRRKFCQP